MPASFSHPRYTARAPLGAGAQGAVYRVEDREDPSRALVAKVWTGAADPAALFAELEVLLRVRAPGLVCAHDLGRDETTGAPFLVEDFVDAQDARAFVEAAPQGERSERLTHVIASVARTLGALHEAGYAHGDVKPAHVRVGDDGRATLLDLGAVTPIGPDARDGVPAAMTKGYAAPELVAGGAPSPRSDVYALGATAWAIATGQAPPSPHPALRAIASWVRPALADVIEAMLAEHPMDRLAGASEVLAAIGRDASLGARETWSVAGRDEELRALEALAPGVHYVVGAAGVGKSHVARAMFASALLGGRDARLVRCASASDAELRAWISALRGHAKLPVDASRRPLVVLDDLHAAPADLREALESFRCRVGDRAACTIVATTRDAPEGAPSTSIGAMKADAFHALCLELGVRDEAETARLAKESSGVPSWVVASLGRVPLAEDAVKTRLESVDAEARALLAQIAIAGGALADDQVRALAPKRRTTSTLLAAGLVRRSLRRDVPGLELASPGLAQGLAAALATFDVVDALADVLLASESDARALLSTANAPTPPAKRAVLLDRAAIAARAASLRSEEIDALLGSCADPKQRTTERLLRLERLARDAGRANAHPRVLAWLEEAANAHPEIRPLALRRAAEKAAREGDHARARELVEAARAEAHRASDPISDALALSTKGALALYRGDWMEADRALSDARGKLEGAQGVDAEELARLHHNLGVVALYQGRNDAAAYALRESLDAKRALGDSAGVRACLLNLGLALARAGKLDESERALEEAAALARSLGQRAGLAWCLAARADLEVRRGDAARAERFTAEAEALGDALPAAVRSDLSILRAQVALLEGDGAGAMRALDALTDEVRAADPMLSAKTFALRAHANLRTLPAAPRAAARLAIRAIREARAASLTEVEALAISALRSARASRKMRYEAPTVATDSTWQVLDRIARGESLDTCAHELARALIATTRAERVFVALLDASGAAQQVFGVDVDGIELGEAGRRVPTDVLDAAARRGALVYQRDVETSGGAGARLAAVCASRRAGVVLEHRFAPRAFDHVREEDAARWATLAAVVGRLGTHDDARPAPASEVSAHVADASTSFPLAEPRRAFPSILGSSAALRRALAKLDAAVDSDLPVLLTGETGVGKEVFARALHDLGRRARAPFVALNCAAIPDSLFEAELFGHARGSFTGADRARPGLVARAEGGTLLLDEIGELPLQRQATLLRVLETRKYRAVGSDDERPFDVRIVAATNRDLAAMVQAGTFRQDLRYRLQVLEVKIPPLRERPEDVAFLARHFLEREGARSGITRAAVGALAAYPWPGNVRELEHTMQRLAAAKLPTIDVAQLPREIRAFADRARPNDADHEDANDPRDEVARALAATGGNISRAAELLGLTRHGLKKRMLRLGMRAPAARGGSA